MKKVQTLNGMYEVTNRELEYLEWKDLLKAMPQGPAIFDGSAAALFHIVKSIPDTWEPAVPSPPAPAPVLPPPVTPTPTLPEPPEVPKQDATRQDVCNLLDRLVIEIHRLNSRLAFLDKLNS